MTPLELAAWLNCLPVRLPYTEEFIRTLCIQAAVGETRRSAELDPDCMDGLAAMELIERRADELYAQITGKDER